MGQDKGYKQFHRQEGSDSTPNQEESAHGLVFERVKECECIKISEAANQSGRHYVSDEPREPGYP